MRHLHEPLKLPKHPQLLHDINEMTIRIKIHHFDLNLKKEEEEKIKSSHIQPTWQEVVELFREAYNAINEQREDPRKY